MVENKEALICYAQKAGFLYQAYQEIHDPGFGGLYLIDSGLMILSRFPIVSQDFHRFSLGLWRDDAEVTRGVLYAKIEVRPGKFI